MELVFESALQPLKRSIALTNHHDAQFYAVEHSLFNDWMYRVAGLHTLSPKTQANECLYWRALRILMLRFDDDLINEDCDGHNSYVKQADEAMQKKFSKSLLKM